MNQQQFAYEKTDKGIRILRCFGVSGSVTIPEIIEGEPVTELASYAFAREMVSEPENTSGMPCICGTDLEELYLPKTIDRIGRYVFYNCLKFHKLSCYGSISYIGAGAFIGCEKLSRLEIQEEMPGVSCMREILSDLKQTVQAAVYQRETCCYELIYPEFYEEAVENTPARIINTETHGMGIQYRNTFRDSQVVWKEYDKVFETGKYNMDIITAVRLCVSRLIFPVGLEQEGAMEYRRFLREHLKETTFYFISQGETERLKWMAEVFADSRAELELMIQTAEELEETGALSMLMDWCHRRFPVQRKKFSL